MIAENMPGAYRVKIRYFASIRTAAGKSEEELAVPAGYTIYALLKLLSINYGEAFSEEVFRQTADGLRDDVIVSINGVITDCERVKNAMVADGSVIDLFTTFPGGG